MRGGPPELESSPSADLTNDRPDGSPLSGLRRRILYLVVTLAEIRPWGDNDDPSEYAALSTDWPHAKGRCPACTALGPWFFTAQWSATADVKPKAADVRRAARDAFSRTYPNRYRGVEAHRRQVRQSVREAPAAAKRVQSEAAKWLVVGLAQARREGLIPRAHKPGSHERFEGPWPYSWFCQEIARSEAAEPFLASMREAYPARFGLPSTSPYKQPDRYAAAVLRAVIAESVVQQNRPSAHSRIAHSVIDELHRVAARDGQTFSSLWLIDDLNLSAVNEQSIDGATFYAPRQFQAQNVVSSLMPEAMWASSQDRVPNPEHGGFIYASVEGARGGHWEPTRLLNERISRLALAIRLATGSTGPTRMIWMGEPSWIHVEKPEAHPQTEETIFESGSRRTGVITAHALPGLAALVSLIEQTQLQSLRKGQKHGTVSSVAIALGRYSRSYTGMTWQDTVLDLATALEACLGPDDKQEISLTLRTRAAHLLGRSEAARADEVYEDVEDLYNLRSDLVHGNARFRRTPQALCDARGIPDTYTLDDFRLRTLLDRWRDIVRRVICARLLLADTRCGAALWPLVGNQVAIDRHLVRQDKRAELCQRLVDEAGALGLPLLVEPAPPLVDYLARGRPI
jgi:hypothetical protein